MDQNQTPWQNQPPTYPPQTPQPAPSAPQNPLPQQQPQPQQQNYQNYASQPQSPYPPQQPTPQQQQNPYQQQQPQPGTWYTQPDDPNAHKPSDVSSYLQSSRPNQQSTPAPSAAGQMVNGQYSVDYLDQMAAPTSSGIDKKMIIAGAGLAVALLVGALMIFMPKGGTASTSNEVNLYTTMVDMEESTKKSSNLIKNSKLAAINSNMRTTMTNSIRDMQKPLQDSGGDPKALTTSAKNGAHNDKKFDDALEDARLNGTYDRIYSQEVNNKMKLMNAYIAGMKKSNNRASVQEFIKKNEGSFTTIQKSIDDWIASPDANLY